jgi:steroid delta-isomerase-like uncharacterized protein
MIDPDLRQRRLAILQTHFETEVTQEFDATLSTFHDHARYEIMPTGEVMDSDAQVMEYYLRTRTGFPDQRHENVRFHVGDDDTITAEFDLLGTNLGEFYGLPPTGRSFRVPVVAVFYFQDDHITIERIYFDAASLVSQIGRRELLELIGSGES